MRTYRVLALLMALLPFSAIADPGSDVRAVRQEIAATRIDRALDLSQDQARSLLPILQSAKADLATRRAAAQTTLLAALTQARDEMKASGVVSDTTRQALAAARKTAWSGMRQEAQVLRQQVMQILTPAQVQALQQGHAGAEQQGGRGAWRAGPRHGKQFVVRALTSDAFLALLQARAA